MEGVGCLPHKDTCLVAKRGEFCEPGGDSLLLGPFELVGETLGSVPDRNEKPPVNRLGRISQCKIEFAEV